ncbi:MAG TPA: hypothetical protein VGK73_07530 [Polyangiaceae bacterium]
MRVPLLLACLTVLGCRASAHGDANASLNATPELGYEGGEGDPDLEAQLRADRATQGALPPAAAATPAEKVAVGKPLLGARHDLTLVLERATGQCSCLKVGLGQANRDAFRWKATTPALDNDTQLVVALSSEGSGCQDPKGSLGASYWGYRRRGDDIVVYVENAVKGRPLTAGAIIPKPLGEGQVFLAPAEKGVPYGKASDGKGNCKLGNPGARRTAPATDDETGVEPGASTDS